MSPVHSSMFTSNSVAFNPAGVGSPRNRLSAAAIETPFTVACGRQQAPAFSQNAIERHVLFRFYHTGCFLTGEQQVGAMNFARGTSWSNTPQKMTLAFQNSCESEVECEKHAIE